jgi:cytochrome c-type biogenesis protein CcmH/NrfF
MQGKQRSRSSWRIKALLVLVFTGALLTGSIPLANPHVRSVGELLTCQCGCGYSITSCNMMHCHFAEPARDRLLSMVEAGMTDEQILAGFEKDYGKVVLRQPPAQGFFLLSWIMPYVGLGGGFVLLLMVFQYFLKKRARAAAAVPVTHESADLARYRERIEKDLADMDTESK